MEKLSKTQALVLIIVAFWSFSLSAVILQDHAQATVYNVTVKWTVPADYSLGFAYPAGTTQILFTPAGQNFSGEDADGQAADVWAMNITNNGNANVYVRANFTAGGMATGVTLFNLSTVFATEDQIWWTDANATTAQLIASALASADHVGFFSWSSGTVVTAGDTTKTLYVASAAS